MDDKKRNNKNNTYRNRIARIASGSGGRGFCVYIKHT